jgi:hypothetical protein
MNRYKEGLLLIIMGCSVGIVSVGIIVVYKHFLSPMSSADVREGAGTSVYVPDSLTVTGGIFYFRQPYPSATDIDSLWQQNLIIVEAGANIMWSLAKHGTQGDRVIARLWVVRSQIDTLWHASDPLYYLQTVVVPDTLIDEQTITWSNFDLYRRSPLLVK